MLEIVTSPNKILLEKSVPCVLGDNKLKDLSLQMSEVMYEYNGIGIAGPQVGILKRIIVIDLWYRDNEDEKCVKDPITLINPEIIEKSEEIEESSEGCLSCPGIMVPVLRNSYVKVKYFDLEGKNQTIEGEGLLSFCLQHEIDHLEGKTLFQSAKPEYRINMLKDYQQALERGIKPGQFFDELE